MNASVTLHLPSILPHPLVSKGTSAINREVPTWCKVFRCRVVKSGLDLSTLQKIAGKEQAKAQTVTAMAFSQTLGWFLKELETVRADCSRRGVEPVINKNTLLLDTYNKTGKTLKYDGKPVCNFLSSSLLNG